MLWKDLKTFTALPREHPETWMSPSLSQWELDSDFIVHFVSGHTGARGWGSQNPVLAPMDLWGEILGLSGVVSILVRGREGS